MAGCAPAAIMTRQVDPILALGSIVAEHLCGCSVPVPVLTATDFASIGERDLVAIQVDGRVRVSRGGSA